MRLRHLTTAATLLAVAALAGCGGDDGAEAEDKVTETVTASATTEATTETTTDVSSPTSPTGTTSVPPMDPTEGEITQEQVQAALLTPEEIAPGLVLGTWVDEDTPPPCDPEGTPADVQIPPTVEGGVEINTADNQASLTEVISIYDSEELATQAFTLGSAGLDCPSTTLPDGTTAAIGSPTDVTAQVNTGGVGESTQWEVSVDGGEIVLIATLSGRLIVANTFVVATGADTSGLPTPVETARAAFAKALAN